MRRTQTEYVGFWVMPSELEVIQRVAEDRCCSTSAVIRWAIRKALASEFAAAREVEMREELGLPALQQPSAAAEA